MKGWQVRSLMVVALASACGPKVHRFDVVPLRACLGDSIVVTYQVRGTPTLVVRRRGGEPSDTTTFTIRVARRAKVDSSQKDVVTQWPNQPKALTFDTDLNPTRDSVVASESLGPPRWLDNVVISVLRTDFDRAVRLAHGGRSAVIPAGPWSSPLWAGVPVAGHWDLRARLLSGEIPGDSLRSPPGNFDFEALVCQ